MTYIPQPQKLQFAFIEYLLVFGENAKSLIDESLSSGLKIMHTFPVESSD